MPKGPSKTIRDKRVDLIGCSNQIYKLLIADAKDGVKLTMTGKGASRAEGDAFDGLLVKQTERSVDPRHVLHLYKAGKISEKEMLACLRVNVDDLVTIVGDKEVDRLSTFATGEPALRVYRKRDLPKCELVEAIEGLMKTAKA